GMRLVDLRRSEARFDSAPERAGRNPGRHLLVAPHRAPLDAQQTALDRSTGWRPDLRDAARRSDGVLIPDWVSLARSSILPEAVEPARGQLGVPDRVLNVPVPEIMLQSPRVLPVIRQLEAAGMPQHMRVNREPKLAHLETLVRARFCGADYRG